MFVMGGGASDGVGALPNGRKVWHPVTRGFRGPDGGGVLQSTWPARLEIVEHSPNAIEFTSLHYLKGCRAVEGRVRFLQPAMDMLSFHNASQAFKQPVKLE